MKISVAMCTYNGSKYLREQLESIASQIRKPDELIVCDDHSKDETTKIIERFAKEAPFTVKLYVNAVNIGVVGNFEKAISMCDGDLVALADQDDIWMPEKLHLEEELFNHSPEVGLVFTNAELIDADSNPLPYDLWTTEAFDERRQMLMKRGRAFDTLLEGNVVTGATMMFRNNLRNVFLPFPKVPNNKIKNCIIHDYWIALVFSAVTEVRFIAQKLVRYRQHQSQLIGASLGGASAQEPDLLTFEHILRERVDQLRFLKETLTKKASDKLRKGTLETLNDKICDLENWIEHLSVRNRIRTKSQNGHLRCVLKELFALRYHKYSNGLRSALKDLILGF